ncbi:Rz-like lysis system protein LysB [Yersinia aldovae]|uniref:Regulatory protein n=1 Tax=Yersinia aldovae TaxID=29483 RepID=A0ABM9SXI0_YERAL|nr:Rz-like lysis system protein LysB [Yersinia aldovae]CNL62728.1 putative regulatory protein [Yersinia aldovae]
MSLSLFIPKQWLVMASLLLAVITVVGVQTWRLSSAARELTAVNEMASTQKQTINDLHVVLSDRQKQLASLYQQAQANDEAQLALRNQLARNDRLLVNRSDEIKRLIRENDTVKRWANESLPVDIIRLRQRPAITGSNTFTAWLSDADTLPATGQ